MSSAQIVVVVLAIFLNALDGFDVMSISFASPGIAAEWGVTKATLGIVLSMELIGMAAGSILLGGWADRVGRRPTLLTCLSIMSVGMFMATTASGVITLSIWRVMTGLGIGGMLASLTAIAAEFSSTKRRHLCVSLVTIGYPFGAVLGGAVVAQLLKTQDWRAVFYLGAAATAISIPLVYFLVPESVYWLSQKQPRGALERINGVLKRLGKSAVERLPSVSQQERRGSTRDIFSSQLGWVTFLVTLAYFMHISTFYFLVKWSPKLIVDMGFTAAEAAGVLMWANVGGTIGGVLFGIMTLRFQVKPLATTMMVVSAACIVAFGQLPPDLTALAAVCALAGFTTNAGVVGLYAIFAHVFPTEVRASGTGFALGVGRGGAVLAPVVAGFLFSSGLTLSWVAPMMAMGSVLGAAALIMLRFDSTHTEGTGGA